MKRRPQRQETCDELARLLLDPRAARAVRLLQRTDLLSPERLDGERAGRKRDVAPPPPGDGPTPISIWQPLMRAGELVFVRPPPAPLGDHFAVRREIPAAKARGVRRLAFFGESVAAGYLHAPRRTPAGMLQELLGAAWEVIDLARTNETLAGLEATVAASLQLAPDLLVVFAGNNWTLLETPELSPYVASVEGRQRLAEALREGGLPRLLELARRRLASRVRRCLDGLAALAQGAGVPLLLVVPEVNLADWESRQPVAWLPGDGVARWYRLLEEGEAQLAEGDATAAAVAAQQLLQLDGGLCPTSHRLLARARAASGDVSGAAAACLAEVDAEQYATLCLLGAPRATGEVRRLLLEAAVRHGAAAVDLRQVFADHLRADGELPLPGRRLYLDYCHLTAEGMAVAMGAVARRILPEGSGGPRPAASMASAEADSIALFGAAIHGAHRWAGDKRGLLEHWCRQALAACPQVAGVMVELVEARCSPLPAALHPIPAGRSPDLQLGFQHGLRWENLDADVIRAVLTTLAERDPPAVDRLEALLLDRLGLGPDFVDLARPYFLWDPLLRFYPDSMERQGAVSTAILRAPWPESRFALVTAGPLEVEICARLPAVEGAEGARCGEALLALDGVAIGAMELAEGWRRRRLAAVPATGGSALHCLSLHWPLPPPLGGTALDAAARRLEQGLEADLHPVFGEIWSLRARAL